MPALKRRKCKNCKEPFQKKRPLQYVCSWQCATEYDKALKEKKDRQQWRERKAVLKESVMTHKDWLKLLQAAFNTYIRNRDKFKGCISCGRDLSNRKFDAGHYRSVGSSPHLRIDEDNCHGQCVPCNRDLHGNLIEYRKRLITRIGHHYVEKIEQDDTSRKLTIPEIKDKIKLYKAKTKSIINDKDLPRLRTTTSNRRP